jgi:Domain of unknown function (DUF4167)
LSLARDALASGDMVAAESYFQHAEHYNRIIMAARFITGDGGQFRCPPVTLIERLTSGEV